MESLRTNILNNRHKVNNTACLMISEHRAGDNFALKQAIEEANNNDGRFFCTLCLEFLPCCKTLRHYSFVFEGLKELEKELNGRNIQLLIFKTYEEMSDFYASNGINTVFIDFSPLREIRNLENKLISQKINVLSVDSKNIIPARELYYKQAYSVSQIRKQTRKLFEHFFEETCKIPIVKKPAETGFSNNFDELLLEKNIDKTVKKVESINGGYTSARWTLDEFIENKLEFYDDFRNNPAKNVLSNLSAYIHFGQISQFEIVKEIKKSKNKNADDFLDQLLVRSYAAQNFCLYNLYYDSEKGFPNWAITDLESHKDDLRSYLYSKEEFEQAKTHDDIWNLAQNQLLESGKIHSYLRMYWAKKILEWSESPQQAVKTAIFLNDKYSLDGTDPNGYAGIAWSIGGLHDRPFSRRMVFGRIRYMSHDGCRKKFRNN